MKQKFYLPLIAAVAVGSFAFSYANTQTPQASNQTLDNVEALTDIELPEVTIECGAFFGRCWKEVDDNREEFGYRCEFDGNPEYYC